MKKLKIYNYILIIAGVLLVVYSIMAATGGIASAGILLVGFFILLAIGFSGYRALKGYVFAALIFAGVVLSLYWPSYFVLIGDFRLTNLIVPLIQIIMFGMGTSMSIKDFAEIIKSPKGVFVGVSGTIGHHATCGFSSCKN